MDLQRRQEDRQLCPILQCNILGGRLRFRVEVIGRPSSGCGPATRYGEVRDLHLFGIEYSIHSTSVKHSFAGFTSVGREAALICSPLGGPELVDRILHFDKSLWPR